jgi:hypothetical protein
MKELDWLYNLRPQVSYFLETMQSQNIQGFYRYSYSGDIYDDSFKWNVGSSVFALKIYYTLGIENSEAIKAATTHIQSFIHQDGLIYDDFIYKKGRLRNFLSAIKHNNLENLFNQQYKRAETRQCYSALMLHHQLPKQQIKISIPNTEKEIDAYLNKLNWQHPWGAGSHFSHLMFFLNLAHKTNQIDKEIFEKLINYAISWINSLQNANDGSWYSGNPSARFKVNGAMKILTGLLAVDKVEFAYPEKLIDLCLNVSNDETACDNFNIILVLNYASKLLYRGYRQQEIEAFALNRLKIYKKHYYKDKGGFSFLSRQANIRYYGVKITKGFNEPDIHGTIMFVWGISIIAQILNINNELGFKEHKT